MGKEIPVITVGELREELSKYPDHYELSFSGLEFNEIKRSGDTRVQIRFTTPVYLDQQGRVVVENPE